jgi:hypothetical protein
VASTVVADTALDVMICYGTRFSTAEVREKKPNRGPCAGGLSTGEHPLDNNRGRSLTVRASLLTSTHVPLRILLDSSETMEKWHRRAKRQAWVHLERVEHAGEAAVLHKGFRSAAELKTLWAQSCQNLKRYLRSFRGLGIMHMCLQVQRKFDYRLAILESR